MGLLSTIGAASGRAFGLTRVGAAIRDAYFNLTTLLLPGNGTNGAQNNTFLDSSSNNFTITRNGNTTQGTFSPFSQTGWSVFLDGAGDYFTANATTLGGSSVSTFTIDGWIFPTTFANVIYVIGDMQPLGTINYISVNIETSGAVTLYWFDGAVKSCTSTGTLTLNQWNYFAIRVSSNAITIYVNSATAGQTGTTTLTSRTGTENFAIGAFNTSATPNAYLSNLRVSTVARTISIPTSAFSNDADTRFLLFQSNRFINNGSTSATLTPFGNTSVQAFSPFAPTAAYSAATVGGSGYFDGNGDYLVGNGQLSTSTSMSTFTVEGWLYPTSLANNYWIIGDMDAVGATNVLSVRTGQNGDLVLYWYDGASKECYSPNGSIRANQWNWFAIVVNNNAISMYVNSTTAASLTGFTTLTNRTQANNFALGQQNNSVTFLGYMGNLRWSSGIARTISSIPTAPYTSDANTRLLLNFTNAGITDATAKNDLETVGNAQISTTQSKFGGSSISFDGDTDYVGFPKNENVNLGSGNFTIEFWAYWNAFGTDKKYCLSVTNGTNYWQFNHDSSAGIGFNFNNGSGQTVVFSQGSNSGWSTGTWYHVALVRNGTTLTVYRNGTSVTSGTLTGSLTNHDAFCVGGSVGFPATTMNGYIDDFRLTKGYARYTANFTAPTAAFALQ